LADLTPWRLGERLVSGADDNVGPKTGERFARVGRESRRAAHFAKKHSLVEADLARLVGWGFGDLIFRTDSDVISDVNKIFNYGFVDRMESRLSLFGALDNLRRSRELP
jgi:hypothetical protein